MAITILRIEVTNLDGIEYPYIVFYSTDSEAFDVTLGYDFTVGGGTHSEIPGVIFEEWGEWPGWFYMPAPDPIPASVTFSGSGSTSGTIGISIYGIDGASEVLLGSGTVPVGESFSDLEIELTVPEPSDESVVGACCLVKETYYTFIPGTAGSPGHPGQEYMPARCVNENYQSCGYASGGWNLASAPTPASTPSSSPRMEYVEYYNPLTNRTTGAWVPVQKNSKYDYFDGLPSSTSPTSGGLTLNCTTMTRRVCYPEQPYIAPVPAVPPSPSQFLTDNNIGWNSSARSSETLAVDGYVEFFIPQDVSGVVAGLNDSGTASGYTDINYAFYRSHGLIRIYENGATVFSVGVTEGNPMLKIRRFEGEVTYYVGGDLVYTSLVPSSGTMFLDVSMYLGGDKVCSARLVNETNSNAELRTFEGTASGIGFTFAEEVIDSPGELAPFEGMSSDYDYGSSDTSLARLTGYAWGSEAAGAQAFTSLMALTGSSRPDVNVITSLRELVGLSGDKVYGTSDTELRAFTGSANSGEDAPSFAVALGSLSLFGTTSTGLTGTIGGGDTVMAPLWGMSADRPYASSDSFIAPLNGFGHAYFGRYADSMVTAVIPSTPWRGDYLMAVMMTSDMTIGSSGSSLVLLSAELSSALIADSSMDIASILQALMMSYLSTNTVEPMHEKPQEVWVMNSDTGAISRYEDYSFNSFAKVGNSYYGVGQDGVYALTADTPVSAMVNLGKHRYNTAWKKRVDACYIGASSSGKLFLRVRAEGKEYTYVAKSSASPLQVQKIPVGKGIRANYMEFELYNEDGDDFELASVEFSIVRLTRRI